MLVIGTRPEAIKLAPVVAEISRSGTLNHVVVATGQHHQLLDQALATFGIQPDYTLHYQAPGISLGEMTGRLIQSLTKQIDAVKPAMVIVQGDTASAVAAAMAAFYTRVPVAHVEAGLRTGSFADPFPEELHRRLIAQIARLHFVPTEANRRNLMTEGISPESIELTGNTGIDALRMVTREIDRTLATEGPLATLATAAIEPIGVHEALVAAIGNGGGIALITTHRRENHGSPIDAICRAVARIAKAHPWVQFVFPLHPNPTASDGVNRILANLSNVHLVQPLEYVAFVTLMRMAALVITDSGGVQEEAVAMGTPTIVVRNRTERLEGVAIGASILVGTEEEAVTNAATVILNGPCSLNRERIHCYGDGLASARIVRALEAQLADHRHSPRPPRSYRTDTIRRSLIAPT